MSESKFTPGPWLVEDERDGTFSVWTRQPHTGTLATVHEEDINGEYPAKANAQLMSAAPDLYKALERIARPHDCGCVPCTGSCLSEMALQITVDEMRELARAAIEKATA